MTAEQYRKIFDLILDFGSSQFLKGAYLVDEQRTPYEKACIRSAQILHDLSYELGSLK